MVIPAYNVVQELTELTVGEELMPHLIREFDTFEAFKTAVDAFNGTIHPLKPTDVEDVLEHFAAITPTGHAVGYFAHDWYSKHGYGTMWVDKYIEERFSVLH